MKVESVNKILSIRSFSSFIGVLIFGIIFLSFAIKLNLQEIPEDYIKTEATITRIEEIRMPGSNSFDEPNYDYHVYVSYAYGGRTYENVEYGSYSSSMKEGDAVLLYLDPNAPGEFICDPEGSFIFVIIGIAVVLLGVGGLAYNIKKRNGLSWLLIMRFIKAKRIRASSSKTNRTSLSMKPIWSNSSCSAPAIMNL